MDEDLTDSESFGYVTSSWAERYGTVDKYHISLLKEDPGRHSWLAPLLPTLPPRYYDKVPRKTEFEIANTFGEIDSILATEEYQRMCSSGLTSWNFPPLNTFLSWDGCPPLLGGHRPGDEWRYHDLLKQYHQQRIEVDEESWFPFFRKDRWYNKGCMNWGDLIENEDGSKWTIHNWTVDDERIWFHIRFVFEIANRILLAMIRDNNEWLEMLLYGRIQLWYELWGDISKRDHYRKNGQDKRVIVPLAVDIEESKKRKRTLLTVKPDPDPEKRIAFVNDLLRNLTWTFLSSMPGVRGETKIILDESGFRVLCRLNVDTLILVCGETISVAERCILYTRIAITTLHELMHAIYVYRLNICNNISEEVTREVRDVTLSFQYRTREPFVNQEPISELGRSFEASVFGGTPIDSPYPGIESTLRGPVINWSLIKYPSLFALNGPLAMVDTQRYPEMKREAPITIYIQPAALLWRLQSKAFWDAPVDGKKGFLFPRLFTGMIQQEGRSSRYTYQPIVVNPDAAGDLKLSVVVSRWNEQMRLWMSRRPWYREAFATWKETAWGFTPERLAIERYIEAFKVRDELKCAAMAYKLHNLVPNLNVKALPGDDGTIIPEYDTREGGPQMWLLHCLGCTGFVQNPPEESLDSVESNTQSNDIGTLMLAALPMRRDDQHEVYINFCSFVRKSAGMLPRFNQEVILRERNVVMAKFPRRNEFFSRISDQGAIKDFKRIELVNHVISMIVYVGKQRSSYISLGWFQSIYDLLVYMTNEMEDENFNEGSWMPEFPFNVPPYEPNAFIRWDEGSDGWEYV